MAEKINKTKTEWQRELTPEQFRITREKGTEQPFAGEYLDNHDKGVYRCACCGSDLFSSAAKYDSGSGWPSFFEPLSKEGIRSQDDRSHGVQRVEVLCSRCDAHLGHLFEDGPEPTGLRYCVNSAALKFDKSDS